MDVVKSYVDMEVWLLSFLNSVSHAGVWSASRAGIFTQEEKNLRYELHSNLCGPRNRSGLFAEEKTLVTDTQAGHLVFVIYAELTCN
jgi:hypothetical protein